MNFYAKTTKEDECFLVTFPQFENINTYGETLEQALMNAEEALNGSIESDFERGYEIPKPKRYEGNDYYEIPLKPHVEIAIELRKIRNNRSQIEVAKELGISYQAYQRLENPRRCNPTIKTLEKIAKVLNRKLEIAIN